MQRILKNIFNIFFPELCVICENQLIQGEELMCISCRGDLPVTNFSSWKNNKVELSFQGRIPIESATALLYYKRKGNVQRLIHQLKYKNRQKIGKILGQWLAEDIIVQNRFEKFDFIIPVPLHPDKLKKRGYNQVTTFGKSMATKLGSTLLENVLVCVSKSKTQTFKNRFERTLNIEEKFDISDADMLKNKHILLIDDIITTGSTLEACSIQLLRIPNIKISIATIAYTM
jgi:ComF family protein